MQDWILIHNTRVSILAASGYTKGYLSIKRRHRSPRQRLESGGSQHTFRLCLNTKKIVSIGSCVNTWKSRAQPGAVNRNWLSQGTGSVGRARNSDTEASPSSAGTSPGQFHWLWWGQLSRSLQCHCSGSGLKDRCCWQRQKGILPGAHLASQTAP